MKINVKISPITKDIYIFLLAELLFLFFFIYLLSIIIPKILKGKTPPKGGIMIITVFIYQKRNTPIGIVIKFIRLLLK